MKDPRLKDWEVTEDKDRKENIKYETA